MLYMGSYEKRISLPFPHDGVGSDIRFVLSNGCWEHRIDDTEEHSCVVKTGHMQHTTTSDLVLYVNVWFLLTYFKLSNSIPFLNW